MNKNHTIYFKQVDRELNLDNLAEALGTEADDVVFAAGSLVEGSVNPNSAGMGNRRSDIDVFIVRSETAFQDRTPVDGREDYDYGSMKVRFDRFEGAAVDIEYYKRELLDGMIGQLNAIDFAACDAGKRLKNWITVPDGMLLHNFLSFLHRLYYSIPVCNFDRYERFRYSVSYDNYFKYMAHLSIQRMDARYDDVLGNLENGEVAVAVEGAREMLRNAVTAYAFSRKESLDREKWIPLRLRNLCAGDKTGNRIYARYVELLFQTCLRKPEDYVKNAEEILGLTDFIVSNVRKSINL